MSYSIDVNGNDNTPEWGYCTVAGCKEEAFPIWFSGGEPDDPDLYLCPTHIGARILHEQTARTAYEELATRAEADSAALRAELQTYFTAKTYSERGDARVRLKDLLRAEHPGQALADEVKAARAEIAYLRQWLRDDLRISNADINDALKARQP